jgi:hypothetical protein
MAKQLAASAVFIYLNTCGYLHPHAWLAFQIVAVIFDFAAASSDGRGIHDAPQGLSQAQCVDADRSVGGHRDHRSTLNHIVACHT